MKLKLIEKKAEVEGVYTFVFEPQEPLSWKAGQYLHYVLHHEPTDDRGSDRWFTISSAPFEKYPHLTTRFDPTKSSSFKSKLEHLEVGKNIEISFLEGDFTLDDPDLEYVFIAGGIGITPYRSILKQLDYEQKPINVTLLYSNRDEHIIFKDELEEIALRNPHFKIQYIFSPNHINEKTIHEFVPNITKPIFYISGPEPLVDSLVNMLKEMEVLEDHIKHDGFPNYPF